VRLKRDGTRAEIRGIGETLNGHNNDRETLTPLDSQEQAFAS